MMDSMRVSEREKYISTLTEENSNLKANLKIMSDQQTLLKEALETKESECTFNNKTQNVTINQIETKLNKESIRQKHFNTKMESALKASEDNVKLKDSDILQLSQNNMQLLKKLEQCEHQISTYVSQIADKNRDMEDLKAQLQLQVQKQCSVEIDIVRIKVEAEEAYNKMETFNQHHMQEANKYDCNISRLNNDIDLKDKQNFETKKEQEQYIGQLKKEMDSVRAETEHKLREKEYS